MTTARFKTDRRFSNRAKWTVRWSPSTRRHYPRRGQPWSVAEDKRLYRLVRKQFRNKRYRGYEAWERIAHALGRTTLAVMSRWTVVKAVNAHLRASRRKRRKS